MPQLQAHRLRAFGVTSEKCVAQMLEVPAIGEQLKGYEFVPWMGSFAPAGTPRAIVDRLNAELEKAVADPGVARVSIGSHQRYCEADGWPPWT